MFHEHLRVCPVEIAGMLDNRIRKWLQNPRKLLSGYLREGMTAMDMGCGPGFFSIEMAQMVGKSGKVIAVDLQAGMLQKVRNKIQGTELESRIVLHQCEETKIGVATPIDFVLMFYMLHEVPNQQTLLEEIYSIVKPDGQVLLVEPSFHVSKAAFDASISLARNVGFTPSDGSKMFLGKTALLKKTGSGKS